MAGNSLSKVSKKGELVKFTLPREFDSRLEAETKKRGLGGHGLCCRDIVVEYLTTPHMSKYMELMKKQKEFELELLEGAKKEPG